MPKCIYGYQIQIKNQFMPILFNFIVFSSTQNFLYFSEHGVECSYLKLIEKKLGGYHVCLGDIVRNISKMGDFCSFSEGSLGRLLQKLA